MVVMEIKRSLKMLSILLTVILIFPCSGATGLCNGVRYDKDIYRCEYGELIGKCRGKDYYVAYDQCVNGIVVNSTASSSNSGTFTDSRDGKTYKWVKIGKQTWTAENLNYNANGSKCYDNNPAYCQKYGRLYNWATAKKACPVGWHLPTKAEWEVLMATAGGEKTAGKYLKATSGWDTSYGNNGTDIYGFTAIPSGFGLSDGSFAYNGYGGWLTNSEHDTIEAYSVAMGSMGPFGDNANAIWFYYDYKSSLYSVRCVKD